MATYTGSSEIPMTRGGEVVWHSYPLPAKDGYILLADPTDTQTAELLSHTQTTIPKGERLGGNHDGEVFADAQLGNTALKLFHEGSHLHEMPGALIDLRVNVAMTYGLSRIRQRIPGWTVRAPALYGAFLPEDALTDEWVYPHGGSYEAAIWSMERIRSRGNVNDVIPPLDNHEIEALTGMVQEVRERYCFTEVRHDYDRGEDNNNLLLEDRSSLVLLDCYAFPDD